MERRYLKTLIVTTILTCSFSFAFAQGSISGDTLCGASAGQVCTLQHLQKLATGLFKLAITIGVPILTIFIVYHFLMAWFAAERGDSNALKEASKRATNAIIGFLIITGVFSGALIAFFKVLGVNDFPLKLLEILKSPLSFFDLIPHAYAVNDLPNPIKSGTLLDLLLAMVRAVLLFFVYPAVIIIWVWTGFLFVGAQGNPEALKKAKSMLARTVIITLVLFLLQGFLLAIQGTVKNITSQATPSIKEIQL